MISTFKTATMAIICFLLTSCRVKKNTDNNQPGKPVFGDYEFDNSGKFIIELKSDSTVAFVKKNSGSPVVENEGMFTCRNDSIFINWQNGNKIKSKFEKKNGHYSFLNGSTTYKRKL